MSKRDNRGKRLFVLGTLIVLLVLVYTSFAWLVPTLSRYIYREQDEIRAHYTALYFASTGEGKTIALEDSVGYVDFDLRNYIGENVTQRDIVYTISRPNKFYNEDGNEIVNVEEYLADNNNELYVLDVWGKPKKIARSTYYYDVEIVKNSGEVASTGVYTFTYEKLGSKAVGKVHSVTCKVNRTDNSEPQSDVISLVVQLSKPYKEVLIINMNVSSRLITFAHKEINMFDITFDKLYIQTSDLFAYHKGDNSPRKITIGDNYYQFTPYAFKLTITWNGYVFDEDKLEEIHIGTSLYPGGDKIDDVTNPDGTPNDDGTTPNPDIDLPFIDVKKSTIAKINSKYSDVSGYSGELVIFVPQSSDIYLLFLKSANTGTIDVKIEAYTSYYVNTVLNKTGYTKYEENIGGYLHNNNDLYNLANY